MEGLEAELVSRKDFKNPRRMIQQRHNHWVASKLALVLRPRKIAITLVSYASG